MKIGIVTVFANNFGSFFQAKALFDYIRGLGHSVYMINGISGVMQYVRYGLFRSCKRLIKGDYDQAHYCLDLHKNYINARKEFNFSKIQKNTDIVLYGSDTIWNIEDKTFFRKRDFFWGVNNRQIKATYAVSVANTPIEKIINDKKIVDALKEYVGISVRDEYTRFVLSQVVESDTVKSVLDPTLLHSAMYYRNLAEKCDDKDFILVYVFDEVSDNIKEQIRIFALKENKRIITVGAKSTWCDKNISNQPYKLLYYFDNASLIITDTFHGNIFSLIFNKQYVTINRNKNKVNDLVARFGLESRVIDNNTILGDVLSSKIDYSVINKKIENLRRNSVSYLDEVFNLIQEKKNEN